ncbi:MAG TPA: DUF2147 domain-containing protein [Lentimicrobium sp.]|nr:DUF2147 domain-containing protein [Lentimicrobium sp.]
MKSKILAIAMLFSASMLMAQTQPVKQSTTESEKSKQGIVVKTSSVKTEEQSKETNQSTTPAKQSSTTTKTTTKEQVTPSKVSTTTKTTTKPTPATSTQDKPSVAPVSQAGTLSTTPKDITGHWLTANKGTIVQFYKEGNEYKGKIVWLRQPNGRDGKPLKDINNPDRAKRNNPVLGMVLIEGLKYNAGTDTYEGGKVYQPQSGRTFNGRVKLEQGRNVMKITGSLGFSLISRTLTWTRTTGVPGK